MDKPGRIVCFGEALIDMLAQPPATPDAPRAFLQFAGGAPANVSVAVARLGGDSHFVGMLGEDMFGDFLLRSLQEAGVATGGVARTGEARTALAFVALDSHGERSFSFYRPPSADLLFRPAHFREESFRDAAVFHVCSNSMTEPALAEATREGMRRAHAAGAWVSFDLNLRPALWPNQSASHDELWPALHLADVVKLSAEEFHWLAGDAGEEATLERLWAGRARLLVVTDGSRTLRWFHPDASGEMPVYAVPTVDSTAAGDAFVGGLLHRLATVEKGEGQLDHLVAELPRLHAMLRFAAACGALTVTRLGSFAAMPDEAEVLAFMDAHA